MTGHAPSREFAVSVVERLVEAGYRAYFAGGCVRDFLLGRPAKDFDIATDARPEAVQALFGKRKTLAVGAAFGVIVVIGPKGQGHVEVATFRSDGAYIDGRRPDSVSFSSPEADAQRRDFTINGMFYDPLAGQLHDFVGGERDLSQRLIRAIGVPQERMREDKLRLLRAVRFAATLEFDLDAETAAAVRELASELRVVSVERIADELRKMLRDRHRRRAMELCDAVNLLTQMFPELDTQPLAAEQWKQLTLLGEAPFELGLATLLQELPPATVADICRRLKLANAESELVIWLVTNQHQWRGARGFSLAELKRKLSHPHEAAARQFSRAALLAAEADLSDLLFCEEYRQRTPLDEINPPPLVTGNELIQLGFAPGPSFKHLLERLRDAQLNGDVRTREEALAQAQVLGAELRKGHP